MKWLLLSAVTLLLFAAPARADYKEGLAALQRGDYAAAHEEFLQLAKEGHATAQYNLGFLYDYGEGVQQNHSEAAKWYRKAAEQGLARAQFSLGIMYESGTGVTRDLARAYKWYSVAAETHPPGRARDTVIESRDLIANRLYPGSTRRRPENDRVFLDGTRPRAGRRNLRHLRGRKQNGNGRSRRGRSRRGWGPRWRCDHIRACALRIGARRVAEP